MKFLFTPISFATGWGAGFAAKKAVERIWRLIDDEEPPDPAHEDPTWPKLIVALAIEGIVFRVVKGLTDHGTRELFARLTGTWPGKEEPE